MKAFSRLDLYAELDRFEDHEITLVVGKECSDKRLQDLYSKANGIGV